MMNRLNMLIAKYCNIRNKIRPDIEFQMESSGLRAYVRRAHAVDVGLYSYGSCFDEAFNGGGGSISVGRYCSFASNVRYFGANHPAERAILSPVMYNSQFTDTKDYDVERSGLTIGNDVWVGYGVVITSGCNRIGNGAVIGARSVVTHDVESYSIVAGSPARERRKRFDKNVASALEESKWWELEPDELKAFLRESYDPLAFASAVFGSR